MPGAFEVLIFVAILAAVAAVAFVVSQVVGAVLSVGWVLVALFLVMLFWIPGPLEPYLGFIQTYFRAPVEFVYDQIVWIFETTFSVFGSVNLNL